MIALIKEPGKLSRMVDIDPTLETLQSIVGGYIEVIHLDSEMILIVRETGKLDGLTPNMVCEGDCIVGTVVALGVSADVDVDFRSLTVDELDLLKIYFAMCSVDRAILLTDKE